MKKLLLLALVMLGGVVNVSAWPDELYLICNENNSWAVSGDAYNSTFAFTKTSENHFRATVPGSYVHSSNWRFRFRVKDSEWWNIGPTTKADFDVTSSSYDTTQKGYDGITEAFYVPTNASAKYIHIYCDWDGSSKFTVSATVVTSETSYTVAFTNPSGWEAEDVKAYVFNDGYVRTTNGWPGDVMTYANGVYRYTFNGSSVAPCIIFSNDGANQTSDLSVVNDAVYNESGAIGVQTIAINSYGMATYCSQYPLDFSTATITEGEGSLSAYRITNNIKETGALEKLAVSKVPAGTGVYVEGTAGKSFTVKPTATATSVGKNMLVGVTENTAIGQNVTISSTEYTNYILTVNRAVGEDVDTPKFFKVNSEGNTVTANKAYLQIPTADASRESFWFDGDVTAIEAAKMEQKMEGEVYNLAGQRVAQPTKGLYIVNGKKVIKK